MELTRDAHSSRNNFRAIDLNGDYYQNAYAVQSQACEFPQYTAYQIPELCLWANFSAAQTLNYQLNTHRTPNCYVWCQKKKKWLPLALNNQIDKVFASTVFSWPSQSDRTAYICTTHRRCMHHDILRLSDVKLNEEMLALEHSRCTK